MVTVLDSIHDLAMAVADSGGVLTSVTLSERGYSALSKYLNSRMPVDIHEACGDYDRPSSPWYGSRPSETEFRSIMINTNAGAVRVMQERVVNRW